MWWRSDKRKDTRVTVSIDWKQKEFQKGNQLFGWGNANCTKGTKLINDVWGKVNKKCLNWSFMRYQPKIQLKKTWTKFGTGDDDVDDFDDDGRWCDVWIVLVFVIWIWFRLIKCIVLFKKNVWIMLTFFVVMGDWKCTSHTCLLVDTALMPALSATPLRGGGDPLARRMPLCNGHFCWCFIVFSVCFKFDQFWIGLIGIFLHDSDTRILIRSNIKRKFW